eukprot:NODE_383_length_1816_cov_118.223543_g322_i0.p1 GENE.NODE_383_length_1816_cov_118.223543_g322_i0~~NODE_383_length_1816_cov_118.223543_g322_i0.p1  ORF type:complete len:466 (-),score=118.66 NODE_383_length_1816_cov_118.223543_g322_i0:142-1539(-)
MLELEYQVQQGMREVGKFTISSVQLDDQRRNCVEPVVLALTKRSSQPWLKFKYHRGLDMSTPVFVIRALILSIAPVDVIIEDSFIHAMLNFSTEIKSLIGESGSQADRRQCLVDEITMMELRNGQAQDTQSLVDRIVVVERSAFVKLHVYLTLLRFTTTNNPRKDPFKHLLGALSVFVRGLNRTPLKWTISMPQEHMRLWLYGKHLRTKFINQTLGQFYKFLQVAPSLQSVHRIGSASASAQNDPVPTSASLEAFSTEDLFANVDTATSTVAGRESFRRARPPRAHVVGAPLQPYSATSSHVEANPVFDRSMLRDPSGCGRCEEVVAMRRRHGVQRLVQLASQSQLPWASVAHHTNWDEFREATTRMQFYLHADLARDQYMKDTLREDVRSPAMQCASCERVEQLKKEVTSLAEFKQKVTWFEFAHHTSWDEFKDHTDEHSFYFYGHLARDQYFISTSGFERIRL